jgi:hypothetical protein
MGEEVRLLYGRCVCGGGDLERATQRGVRDAGEETWVPSWREFREKWMIGRSEIEILPRDRGESDHRGPDPSTLCAEIMLRAHSTANTLRRQLSWQAEYPTGQKF